MNLSALQRKEKFYRLEKWVRACIQMRISKFPEFRCYLRSDVYSGRHTFNNDYYARAHMANSYLSRKLCRGKNKYFTIEFNDFFDEYCDVEMVLYHELAHFIARRIYKFCPSHGLLWAASCDALQIAMDMDEDSLHEGTYWITQVSEKETESTFRIEGIEGFDEWVSIRKSSQYYIKRALNNQLEPIHFEDLYNVVSRYHNK